MDVRDLETSLKNRPGNLVKYTGIYTSDNLPHYCYNLKPFIFIANTLKSSDNVNTMGHWIGFYIETFPNKRIVFFDSFGISPYNYINIRFPTFLENSNTFSVYHFATQFQPDSSIKCGLYVCMFVHYTSIYGINMFTSYIFCNLRFKTWG